MMAMQEAKTTTMWCALMVAVFVSSFPTAHAEILNVPDDYAYIQDAIDAAVDGDEVVIADGKYSGDGNKYLDFFGKAITVRSASGDPSQCIIDCENDGRGFYFHSQEGPDSIVAGVMVTQGNADYGAGVYCDNSSSPTLTNCRINKNYVTGYGGGVYCTDSSHPTLTDCTIASNRAHNKGAGVYCGNASSVELTDCAITVNSADTGGGGGITCHGHSRLKMTSCEISDNTTLWDGGGLYAEDSTVTVFDCKFNENSTTAWLGYNRGGGSVSCNRSTVAIDNCTISGGMSVEGAGVFSKDSDLTVTDCSIVENWALEGGGVYCEDSTALFARCKIIGSVEGGGIYFTGCSPTITKCVITDSTGSASYGIHCEYGDPTIVDCTISRNLGQGIRIGQSSNAQIVRCTISNNFAEDGMGGGIRCWGTSTITDCTISGNVVGGKYGFGGGVYIGGTGSTTLTNCRITGNSTLGDKGGGICCFYNNDNTTIDRCTISENVCYANGGGIGLFRSPTITNCTISDNRTEATHSYGNYGGGGIYCQSGSIPLIANCIITGNTTASWGGGIYLTNNDAQLVGCTITNNLARKSGGGIYNNLANLSLANCIIWENSPDSLQESQRGGTLPATYCNIQGGTDESWFGIGCIDTDPLFAFIDDFHLTRESPCIDTGTNNPTGGLPANDLDGNPRPLDGDDNTIAVADMGAYEFNTLTPSIAAGPTVLELTAREGDQKTPEQILSIRNCGGGNLNWEITGQSQWISVSPLGGTSSGEVDEVSVNADVTGLTHGIYTATLTVSDPQAVNSPREMPIEVYVTNVLRVPDEYATIQEAIDAAIPCDVIEIANGIYTGTGNMNLNFNGKAITLRSESGDPSQCVIDCENEGYGFGFNNSEGTDSIIEGLTVTNAQLGIGMIWYSSPTIINCMINNCSGGGVMTGGGIICLHSEATLIGCTIASNSSGYNDGGGVACFDSRITMTNCLVVGNTTAGEGGGVYLSNSDAIINACTFVGNSAGSDGGGLAAKFGSSPIVTNCVFSGNSPNELSLDEESQGNVRYCLVQNATPAPWLGEGVIDAAPMFIDADGPDNDPDTWDDNDLRLSPGSPCIDAGDNSAVSSDTHDLDGDGNLIEPTPFDMNGDPRFVDDVGTPDTGVGTPPIVDMGAFEFQFASGDVTGDGIIDLDDFALLSSCMLGPDEIVDENCRVCDFDDDGDVDLNDFSQMQRSFAAR